MTSPPHHRPPTGTRAALVVVAVLLAATAALALRPASAFAAPAPSPSPAAVAADCAAKAPGAFAWCMTWAVHVDTPPGGTRSHWVTECSKATSDTDRESCAAASITLREPPRDGTASVLMDGPSTGAGPKGLINCSLQAPVGSNPGNPLETAKKDACTRWSTQWAQQFHDPDPKQPDCPVTDVSCKVERGAQDALASGVRQGIQGLVDLSVQAMVFLLSKLAAKIFTATSISSADSAFYSVYNSIAGVMIALIVVFFIISAIINGLRTSAGPGPLSTLGGLVRAIVGITFAGGIAYTIVAAWDQATSAVIAHNATTEWDPGQWSQKLTELSEGVGTTLLALFLSLLGCVGLLLLFIIMLFRGLLATGAALFGAVAMAGQVMPETRHWGRRWLWTVNALASSKFVIAELWIYGSRSAYESDDLLTVLRAVLLIWLMVAAPWILLRLTTLWDGYLSDVNAYGIASAAGNPLELPSAFADGARSAGSGGGGGQPDAAGLMASNTADTPVTPGGGLEDIAGDDGTGKQVADAASTGADGGRVGEPSESGTSGDADADAGSPNADEADALEDDTRSAQQDLHDGSPSTPHGSAGQPGESGADSSTAGDPAAGAAIPASPPIPGGADAGDAGGSSPSSGSGGSEPATGSAGAAAADVPIVPL